MPPVEPTAAYLHPLATDLDDSELVAFILDVFKQNKPVVSSLFLVAFENLPLRYANFRKAMLKSNKYLPTMDGLVTFVLSIHAEHQGDSLDDEIRSRRWFYFYVAALLSIAQDRARNNPNLWGDIADIWVLLMAGSHALRRTIDQTSLWDPHEVLTFTEIQTEADGEKFVASVLLPKELHDNERFRQWTQPNRHQESRDLFSIDKLFPDIWGFEAI